MALSQQKLQLHNLCPRGQLLLLDHDQDLDQVHGRQTIRLALLQECHPDKAVRQLAEADLQASHLGKVVAVRRVVVHKVATDAIDPNLAVPGRIPA